MTFMTLPQRIELEQGKKTPSEIRELTLSHSKSTVIEGLSDEFTNLEVLNLVSVGLEDLSGLPKLPSLKILDLSNNAISGGLEALLNCPNLETLNLSANKVATIDALVPLAKLSCLSSIDLFNCEVTGLENYRKTVFAALPNLKYLDGLDENNEEEPTGAVPNGDVEEAGSPSACSARPSKMSRKAYHGRFVVVVANVAAPTRFIFPDRPLAVLVQHFAWSRNFRAATDPNLASQGRCGGR
ncbi:hypothetical protein CRM22_008763 [Opisthorchis felineus]|nr:hypothetical protein CRM22_008763 [Opisthorchis felineus]TGZ60068.1 hypothetical protein CRM22_008763 [Opisthorchis felineus]